MSSKALGITLLACSAGMWIGGLSAIFTQSWWPLGLGVAAGVIGLVSIVAWAAQLE